MTLANGPRYLAIPGPSVAPEAVLRAMHRTAPNIYKGELHEITASLLPDLRSVARTEQNVAMYIANGHGAWEAALCNVLSRGDKVLSLVTGRFGEGWGQMATALGAEVEVLDFGRQGPIDPARLRERLRADTDHSIKAVLAVHVDTATSVRNDVKDLRAALTECGHPALLVVDCIASLGCDPMEMDAWGVDVLVAASQKGLMTPPGMAFVYYSDRADAVREGADLVTPYWDWRPRARPEIYYQHFCGTAPTHHIYGLRAALDLIMDEGIEAVWARHGHLARAVWAALDVWGAAGPMTTNIPDPQYRSHAVTSVRLEAPYGKQLQDWTETRAGLTLGIGLGMNSPQDPHSEGAFRIGHMGHVNGHMIMGVLGTIEAGLKALNVPHGDGALTAAAAILAEA